ncbi:hypothetical protein QVD17_26249 [Tagetes erecta]|uniref:Uncharacterized protein n=1 Tax=Tagetes erecta TaxID=13708 RepID=A0AAD8K6I3_TARER|nr:hypothetical protein QVD17_26249 [Tagetes erecta]
MASEQTSNEGQQEKGNENPTANTSLLTVGGFKNAVFEQYRKAKENAEAYPYVWASYLIVYGGFGLWVTYRYKKLRNTEDRVRTLQERLRAIRQEQDSTSPSTLTENVKSSIDKGPKYAVQDDHVIIPHNLECYYNLLVFFREVEEDESYIDSAMTFLSVTYVSHRLITSVQLLHTSSRSQLLKTTIAVDAFDPVDRPWTLIVELREYNCDIFEH